MMKLTSMWKLVATLGADHTCPIADEILQRWEHDAGSVRFFRASANFICVFTSGGRRQFLRFNEVTERPLAQLTAEVELLRRLDAAGIAVAVPVPSRAGRLVETVGDYHAVVFTGLEGAHRELDDCSPADFRAWGGALGRLHAALRGCAAPGRPSWREYLELGRAYVKADEPGLLAEYEALLTWASALPTGSDDYGLIHFDFESDNLVWQDGAIAILDFDDCACHWYVADIAYALRDLFEDGLDLANPLFEEFLAGYREHHAVNAVLLAQLPMFYRLHAFHQFGRLARACDLPPAATLPEWLRGLNAKLSGRVERYRTARG